MQRRRPVAMRTALDVVVVAINLGLFSDPFETRTEVGARLLFNVSACTFEMLKNTQKAFLKG